MSKESYEKLRARGFLLAGGLSDLSRRAYVYHHLYADSGRRNVFPLIAAHGALWASGYFRKGMLAGRVISLQHLLDRTQRTALLASLVAFADKFRDINRRVCAESYAIYYYTKMYGRSDTMTSVIGADFLDLLCESHASRRVGTNFPREKRSRLFHAFFDWEQENIVAPSIIAAYQEFEWNTLRKLALQPRISFSYFGPGHSLKFEDFSSKRERIHRGLQAYERAEEVGCDQVEQALLLYKIMPANFLNNSAVYFESINGVLPG